MPKHCLSWNIAMDMPIFTKLYEEAESLAFARLYSWKVCLTATNTAPFRKRCVADGLRLFAECLRGIQASADENFA